MGKINGKSMRAMKTAISCLEDTTEEPPLNSVEIEKHLKEILEEALDHLPTVYPFGVGVLPMKEMPPGVVLCVKSSQSDAPVLTSDIECVFDAEQKTAHIIIKFEIMRVTLEPRED